MSRCFGLAMFSRDARGGVAVMAALMLLVILLFVGASVDYSRLSTARTQLQSTADAAALDAARAASTITTALPLLSASNNTMPCDS